jgi:hypothetical protein
VSLKSIAVITFPCIVIAQTPQAQADARARAWSNVTTLSFVAASGNSSVNTVGFSNDFIKKWNLTALTIKGGMIRSQTVLTSIIAVGSSLDDVIVSKSSSSSVTAENYFLNGRLDYRLKDKDRWYWYSGASWERNLPIGLSSRLAVTIGLGRIFANAEKTKWRVDAGIGATREEPVVVSHGFQRDFGTLNLTSELRHKFNDNVNYSADLAFTDNLKESDEWMLVFKQGLTVTMTRGTALKIGFDIHYRNKPSLLSVKAHTTDNPPVALGDITIRAKKLDTVTTTSLVITF